MRHALLALSLAIFAQPCLGGVDTEPGEADTILAMMRSQYNGLEGFLPLAPSPAVCDRNQPPVTHAMLVAADKWGTLEKYWLRGPKNDTEYLQNTLVARGADPAHILRLTDLDATYAGVTKASQTLLDQTNCGDSVILQVSGFAFEARLLAASKSQNGPFSDDPKTVSLGTLGAEGGLKNTAQDWIIQTGPFLILNQGSPGKGDILSAAALSDIVTLFRNKGANVSVVLDIPSAEEMRIEDWQTRANSNDFWRESYVPNEANGEVDPYPQRRISTGAGALSVFYGARAGETGAERRFPKGAPGRKFYGQFSFDFTSTLLQAERTTAIALMRQIKQTDMGRTQAYVFTTTDAEYDLVAEARPATPITKGEIQILDPAPTRAAAVMKAPQITLRGVVKAAADTMVVTVNGSTAKSSTDGKFEAEVVLQAGVNRIDVLAMTRDNQPITHSFELVFEGDMAALLGSGARYAVLIANQDYAAGSGLAQLSTPIGDAEALAQVLTRRYGFQTEAKTPEGEVIPLFLRNAGRLEIETVLYQISRIAGARDTVLIFYAGHGIYEPATQGAFWLPIDAKAGLPFSYLPAAAITDAILRIEAGNILVISDSCYSGALLRGGDLAEDIAGDRLLALQRLADKRSRIVIASGGNEPVLDGGGDGHSIFAKALLAGLQDMDEDAFTARELFDRYLLPMVIGVTAQEPQFRPIERSGHEGGDVVFARTDG